MKLGLILRNSGPEASRHVRNIPRIAEDLNFGSLWVSDHLLVPASFADRYDAEWHEATAALAYVAASTNAVHLGFSALILPYRHPALAARQIATIHDLSGGRAVVGAGSGWLREEFDALGLDFDARGRATDDAVKAIRDVTSAPVLAAGNGPRVVRRAAETCDGWHPIALSPPEIAARRAALPGDVPIVLRARFHVQDTDRDRPLFGTPQKILSDVREYSRAGVAELVLDYAERDYDGVRAQIEAFARDVHNPGGAL